MGNKEEKKTKIKTKLNIAIKNKVENFNKNVNKSVTDITMNVTNSVVNEFKSENKSTSVAENTLKGITIMATDGSEVDITQDADSMAEMAAVVQIMADTNLKNDMASQIGKQFETAMKNQTELQNSAEQAAKTDKHVDKSGGFESMVAKIMDSVTKIMNVGGSSKSETEIEQEVTTQLENDIKNTSINISETISKMKSEITNEVKNMSEDKCLVSAEARNKAEQMNLLASGGSKIRVMQKADAKAVGKCISIKKIGMAALNTISNDESLKNIFDSDNTTKAKNASKQTKSKSEKIKERDAISDTINDLGKTAGKVAETGIKEAASVAKMGMGVILLPVIIIGGGIGLLVVMKMMGSMGGDDEDYDEMEGGFLSLAKLTEIIDMPIMQRAMTLILIAIVLDIILKKTKKA